MRSTSCEIHFPNNPSRVYYAGQMLSGHVVLKLTKPKTVRAIYLKIIGRAHCKWTTGSGNHRKTNVGEEFYINEKTFLVGGDSGEVHLSANEYNHTFSCMLAAALPTSVEGKIGYIRYSVAVHIEKPLWSDRRFQEYFTVLKALNLNDEIVLRYPLVREDRKNYFFCCLLWCSSGQLVVRGNIPVGGYVPGQTIELLLQINNGNNQLIDKFTIQIVKHIQYNTHANSSTTKYDKAVVKVVTCNGCSPYQSKTYPLSVTVPALPPTDESTSNIVKVSYRLQIQGSTGGCREDPVLIFPMKIGTYPILLSNTVVNQPPTVPCRVNYGTQSQQIAGNTFHSTPYMQQSLPRPTAPSTDADDIDPPTYEEAISCYPDVATAFRPSYPVFRRTPSYTAISST